MIVYVLRQTTSEHATVIKFTLMYQRLHECCVQSDGSKHYHCTGQVINHLFHTSNVD